VTGYVEGLASVIGHKDREEPLRQAGSLLKQANLKFDRIKTVLGLGWLRAGAEMAAPRATIAPIDSLFGEAFFRPALGGHLVWRRAKCQPEVRMQ
jgi:hypothetical protein